ncbi:DNA sulfur modification protein DndD [Planomicrobium koreense]|uniref:Nuclease SbcCD subunit C n=1 Tax=Planococcus koreensis TaxID=112331 RepID=A0A7W8CTL7_9BACL|nr:DNA sulfur modification protein DndD [Planococcus koreensis]MBB5180258.1 DNA sulfur modification protein DndD [Planococcus koreensis]
MILNEIQLTNIGAYRGNNTFDLRTTSNANVILIGGENGAGKTTLLNAIKVGLFGSFGFGYKNDSADYFKRVSSILNNTAKKVGENNFRIKLHFTLVDGYEKTDYLLYRHWRFKNNSLKENYELVANGHHLSDQEREFFQSKLKEVMPPQLLDLCLFDGEEISRIVNEDLLSSYLKKLSKVVFNLDIFETLETDLETYSNQSVDLKKMESAERELYDLNIREKELKERIFISSDKVQLLKSQQETLNDEYKQFKNDFEKNGGLAKSVREEILKEINTLEHERKQNTESIRDFVASSLPFHLTFDLLDDVRKQISSEESLHFAEVLDTKLNNQQLKQILDSLGHPASESSINILKEGLLTSIRPEKDLPLVHGASFSESSLVENIYIKTDKSLRSVYIEKIAENNEKLQTLRVLREKLKINDTTNEFSDMIQSMEKIQGSIAAITEDMKAEETLLADLNSQLNQVNIGLEKVRHLLKDSEKTSSSFLESQKIIALSRRFREIQLQKKLQQVQFEASIMLKRILRKQNYVSSIIIDPKTYEVKLLDHDKEYLEKATLSAGEKQILLISIIWSIFKCSGRKVPFIFDTLLGRLDKTHKASVLKEFIPNSGRQAIILSTDTEIDETHYNILKEHIAKEYMLDFDVTKNATKIHSEYFPFKDREVKI